MKWIVENSQYSGNDCLVWPFEIGRYGYGTVKHEGKKRPASRVMCIVAHGEPPSAEYEAAHSCGHGKSGCMNPKHIRWATKLENIMDTVAAGKNVRGERCHWAKLTEEDVRKIRVLGKSMYQKDIAKMYGVHPPAIGRILSGKRWRWLKD